MSHLTILRCSWKRWMSGLNVRSFRRLEQRGFLNLARARSKGRSGIVATEIRAWRLNPLAQLLSIYLNDAGCAKTKLAWPQLVSGNKKFFTGQLVLGVDFPVLLEKWRLCQRRQSKLQCFDLFYQFVHTACCLFGIGYLVQSECAKLIKHFKELGGWRGETWNGNW